MRLLLTNLLMMTFATMTLASAQNESAPKPSFHGGDVPRDEDRGSSVGTATSTDVCKADVSEHDGIVSLAFSDPSRGGAQTTFTLDDITYAARFDAAGYFKVEAPILHRTADLVWFGSNGQTCRQSGLVFAKFRLTFLIALVWQRETTDLALHIVEPPNGRLGGKINYVFPGRPNLDEASGLGHLRTFGSAVAGTSQVQLYTLPADRNPHAGSIYAFIEFASRGNPARSPFCGADEKAVTAFKIFHLDGGILERRNGKFGAVVCGTGWTGDLENSGYFQIWKWTL